MLLGEAAVLLLQAQIRDSDVNAYFLTIFRVWDNDNVDCRPAVPLCTEPHSHERVRSDIIHGGIISTHPNPLPLVLEYSKMLC